MKHTPGLVVTELLVACKFAHDVLNANFAGFRTVEERRATKAINALRSAIAKAEKEEGK